jgi:hypothetical protein
VLSVAEPWIEKNIHPTIIISAYSKALAFALQHIDRIAQNVCVSVAVAAATAAADIDYSAICWLAGVHIRSILPMTSKFWVSSAVALEPSSLHVGPIPCAEWPWMRFALLLAMLIRVLMSISSAMFELSVYVLCVR